MNKESLIPANEFCKNYKIEFSFITSLQEYGLIDITTIGETGYIHEDQLQYLERIVTLYYDLDINLEGIETVFNLLGRINELQDEIIRLRNKLRLYETDL
jgi:chaperone modulatory protein CbpM